jgi:hypothetical protein
MSDFEAMLRPFAETVLEPGEEMLGTCIASQQTTFRGWMVAIVVTDRHLVLQRLKKSKQLEADGEPLRLAASDIASAKTGSTGDEFANPTIAVVDALAVTLRLRTTDGQKLKLMIMRGGDGAIARMGGGQTQSEGVEALGHWFQRNAGAAGA